ncbi:hypothetical protein ACIQWR_12115 [Streptomyces sp. NPDC098789]|uniref:hypothetical protein n=1 Tax=Streptomyces sp. NPDC098789 TaxID=3366098 RepID=UPI003826047A
MSTQAPAVGRVCHRCHGVIRAGGHETIQDPASGPRWEHDIRDSSCRQVRADAQ